MRKELLYIAGAISFVSCKPASEITEVSAPATTVKTDKYETIDMSYLDKSVRPQDDFFQYSNGTCI